MTASTWMDLPRGHYATKIHHHGEHIGPECRRNITPEETE